MYQSGSYSISERNKPIFTEFNKLDGNKSEHIAKAVKEFLYRMGMDCNDITPDFNADIDLWKRYLHNLNEKDALKFDKQYEHIGRIFRVEIEKFGR